MAESIAAVDVGDKAIIVTRWADAVTDRSRLLHAGQFPIPADSTLPSLARQLRQYWRSHRILTRTVSVSLRSRLVSVKTFQYPAMTDAELDAALSLEAADLLALPREDVAFDYRRTSTGEASDSSVRTRGILVAAPRERVQRRIRLIRAAGLYPVRVRVPGLAAAELIRRSADGPTDGETVGLINLAGTEADIVLQTPDSVYPRTVRRDQGAWTGDLAALAQEVTDAVRYARFGLRMGETRRLWLTGRLPATPDLSEILTTATGIDVAVWNPLDRLGLRVRPNRRQHDDLIRNPSALTVGLGLTLPSD